MTPAIVIPTYDNAGTLTLVLDALRPLDLPIVVVDDASTDETPAILDRWHRANPSILHVERHAHNRGKAQALRTGFAAATALGASHALTIDSDAQHDPADVVPLLSLARDNPTALILGVRPWRIPACPARCTLGRRVANTLVTIETLVRLADTQCGLRVYPLDLVRALPCRAERFGYETEIIVRAAWAGADILEADVRCIYEVPGGRVSHWRPVIDTLRESILHARLLARSFTPIPHPRWPHPITTAQRAAAWISPRTLWRQMRDASRRDVNVPASLALGAFVACSPLYGLHAWLSLYLAWRLRLHPVPALIGSMLSTPPLGLLIVAASLQTGHLLLTGHALTPADLDLSATHWWALPARAATAWLLGSTVVGAFVAATIYLVTSRAARLTARAPTQPNPDHEPA